MDNRDDLTKQYFNGRVAVDMGGQTFAINGRVLSDADIAGVTGAPDGSNVVVSLGGEGILMTARNGGIFEWPAEYALVQVAGAGNTLLLDETLMLKTSELPEGIGLRIFATQAHATVRLGIQAIALQAAGKPGSVMFNGYYTWPRYGFDAPLTAEDLRRLPHELGASTTVADLMNTAAGRAWWKANGHENYMEFDLTCTSRSWQTLTAVMKDKGVKL